MNEPVLVGSDDLIERAKELAEALVTHRARGDRFAQAKTLIRLGNIANNTADYANALAYLHEAEDICTQSGEKALAQEVTRAGLPDSATQCKAKPFLARSMPAVTIAMRLSLPTKQLS